MHSSRYFTPEAANFRYDLLTDQQKAAVLFSPENMLMIERYAYSRLKRNNALGRHINYADAFKQIHEWFYESIKRLGVSEEEDRQEHAESSFQK